MALRSFLALLLTLSCSVVAHQQQHQARIQGPSRDFSTHAVVRPRTYHGRSKRLITSTKEGDTEHAAELRVALELNGEMRVLELRLNTDLVPYGYKERHQHRGDFETNVPDKVDTEHAAELRVALELNGEMRVLELRLNTDLVPYGYKERHQHRGDFETNVPDKVELCHYRGSVQGLPGSWVALSTCHGLSGVIFDGENHHYIHPETESLDSRHYLYKHTDLVTNHTC
ncbi:disintegrin and metalloproteinase domain-containing protein 22, partial [Copidosoma floridanum]|uniref:disintegrin and metalloproteinase domain-containing protein 22 n=1 Tax=Copidosoma floridanum TaxID=29053 RepID=UPI0006C9AA3B